MKPVIQITPYDRAFYDEFIRDFLPPAVIDIHTHVWLEQFRSTDPNPRPLVTWPARVASENSIEHLRETYELMFPGKIVTPLVFANVLSRKDCLEAGNDYIAECMKTWNLPGLIWSTPDWNGQELETKIRAGNFRGAKSYLALAPAHIPDSEITIYDFFPPPQLEVLNHHGWIMMLHIPRPGRLRDPVNLRQMIEIEKKYPNIKLIIAHVGRAYCPEDIGNAFETLADTRSLMFDISANTNRIVFEKLISEVGSERILFGSDLPIARMRMRRICENGRYVNLVPRGLYGDVSADPNMREVEVDDAEQMTFFLYEEIKAFRLAAEKAGLNKNDIEDIFCHNARRLIQDTMET
ncbi:MAG: amidohydrolase family protein [Phycisphaerae bacterium]